MEQRDADLIRRWQGGEEAAFAQIVRRWEAPLGRFLSRLATPELVPDLLQEVFLRLHRAGPKYRENGHFSTWLFQIALNVARDAGRRRIPKTVSLPDEQAPESAERVERNCEQRELGETVRRAVAELPQPLREVLALRHDQGMSFEAMSRMLGVPASTLKSRFTTALLRLRERLREWEDPEEGGS
jgi:RNA polymerase sigma-70 factor (ECF subfamily)